MDEYIDNITVKFIDNFDGQTLAEKEQTYFEMNRINAEEFFSNNAKKTEYETIAEDYLSQKRIKNPTKKKSISRKLSDIPYFGYMITPSVISNTLYKSPVSVDEAKKQFRSKICEMLDIDEVEIRMILDEIRYLWEFEEVLEILDEYGTGDTPITALPKRNRKKLYEDKRKFMREKDKVMAFLVKHNLSTNEVQNLTYQSNEDIYVWSSYENALARSKKILYINLTGTFNVGARRAKEITKLLEYI